MIKKIVKVKNIGIFNDYKWDSSLNDFCRFNLIYGWNGSGKTTLSKLFSSLETGSHLKHPHLEYEVDSGSKKWKNGQVFDEKVRVFNRDYVLENVEKIDGSGPNPIFILGDENKKLVKQIEEDENEVADRETQIATLNSEKAKEDTSRGEIFTKTAKTISENVSGEATRNYRKPNAESDFTKITQKTILDSKAVAKNKSILSQQEKPALDLLEVPNDLQESLNQIVRTSSGLLGKEVVTEVISRLTENTDIYEWVETGIELHNYHDSKVCEFCGQTLPEDRIKALGEHFNEADKQLKIEVEEQLVKLRELLRSVKGLQVRESSNLYTDLEDEYKDVVESLTRTQAELDTGLTDLGKKIAEKKLKTTEKMSLEHKIEVSSFTSTIAAVNKVIEKHNQKTSNFEKEKDKAREALKNHYLSDIVDEIRKIDESVKLKSTKITMLTDGVSGKTLSLADLRRRVTDNRAKVSSSHKACKQINDRLKMFLGRDEIVFEVSGDGYVIKRHDEIAQDLSEGERTAIAFVYFTVQLQDQNFDLKNGIVVIDDPISSLDSNSLFQAFAFLKDSVKDAKQVFIFTHNFEFMRQVKNWFFHIRKVGGVEQRSFYMISNKDVAGKRTAYLAPLDKLLMEYESEYHYLFSLLQRFNSDGTLESVYNFPNIGRKFLETFLAFKVPSSENIHNKLSHIDYDDTKKTAVLRFVETHSHAERSDGVLNFDMSLTKGGQTAISDLLDMVKTVDQVHYDTLLAAHNKSSI
jgi:wobble nucleotide-excising tRNase